MLSSVVRSLRSRRAARSRTSRSQSSRPLSFDQLEERRMLTTFVETQQLIGSDVGPRSEFADTQQNAAIDRNTMVLGAWEGIGRPGAAYVYTREDNGTPGSAVDDVWSEQAKLTVHTGAERDGFGISTAIDQDTIVVGAFHDPTVLGTGAAYVFVRNDNGTSIDQTDDSWIQQARLTASDASVYDRFGRSVAIQGDTIVVGADFEDCRASIYANCGSAYVFVRDDSGTPHDLLDDAWTQLAKLTPNTRNVLDSFGANVDIDGDTIVVGSQHRYVWGTSSAYAFVRDDNGTPNSLVDDSWSQQAKLNGSSQTPGDLFSQTVSIEGNTVVLGAPLDDDAGDGAGAAYVFQRGGTNWFEQAKLTGNDTSAVDIFGFDVDIDDGTIVVGAHSDDAGAGAIYVFSQVGATWIQAQKLIASDRQPDDQLGHSVAIDGDTIVAGAQVTDNSGKAYVFAKLPFDNVAGAEAAVVALLDKVDGLGLSSGTENSLTSKLNAVLNQLKIPVPQSGGLLALVDAFITGVEKNIDDEELRLELIFDAELIKIGLEGLFS